MLMHRYKQAGALIGEALDDLARVRDRYATAALAVRPSPFGPAIEYDGADSLVNLGINGPWDGLTARQVSAWVYLDGWGEGDMGRIVDKNNGAAADGWWLNVNPAGGGHVNDLVFGSARVTHQGNWLTPDDSIETGRWIHVAAYYDESLVANNPVIYVDGVLQVLDEIATPNGGTSDAGIDLAVGNRANQDRTFDGAIRDFLLFERELAEVEVQSIHEGGAF